jgi:mRNA interferase MazF
MVAMTRGDVALCDLNSVIGTEQPGVHLVVILLIDRASAVSPYAIIASLAQIRGIDK